MKNSRGKKRKDQEQKTPRENREQGQQRTKNINTNDEEKTQGEEKNNLIT